MFINKIATHLMVFAQEGIRILSGNYQQYLQNNGVENHRGTKLTMEERLLLENDLAMIMGKLATTKDKKEFVRLDEEYRRLVTKMESTRD